MKYSYCGLQDSSSWYAEFLLTKQIISIKSVGITVPLDHISSLDDLFKFVIHSFQLYKTFYKAETFPNYNFFN